MGQDDKDNDPCKRVVLTRAEKLLKWEQIYSKALDTIDKCLGIDKDAVYAACSAITTGSREIQIIERVMRTLGEGDATKQAVDVIGWGELPKEETANA